VPLLWLLAVTMSAGIEKIAHPDPRIGFLAQAHSLRAARPQLETALVSAQAAGTSEAINSAEKALRTNRVLHFNNLLDAAVALGLLVLTGAIFLVSVREWWLLLARRRSPVLRESDPVWLPDFAVTEPDRLRFAGAVPLALALLKELSAEAHLERAHSPANVCECNQSGHNPALGNAHPWSRKTEARIYVEMTESRFNGVTRCC
jgi:hypothetical protein